VVITAQAKILTSPFLGVNETVDPMRHALVPTPRAHNCLATWRKVLRIPSASSAVCLHGDSYTTTSHSRFPQRSAGAPRARSMIPTTTARPPGRARLAELKGSWTASPSAADVNCRWWTHGGSLASRRACRPQRRVPAAATGRSKDPGRHGRRAGVRDFNGDPHSSIVISLDGHGGRQSVKVLGLYDNECLLPRQRPHPYMPGPCKWERDQAHRRRDQPSSRRVFLWATSTCRLRTGGLPTTPDHGGGCHHQHSSSRARRAAGSHSDPKQDDQAFAGAGAGVSESCRPPVPLQPDCVGARPRRSPRIATSEVAMLENLHFHGEEEPTTRRLRVVWPRWPTVCQRRLRAPPTCPAHRCITRLLPRPAGFLMARELGRSDACRGAERPIWAILGPKVSTSSRSR